MAQTDPTPQQALALFDEVEQHFATTALGAERWYILMLAAITAGGHTELSGLFYTHLISRPEFQTPAQRQALVRRLREALVKLVAVVGVPKPLEAVFSIAAVEREEDRDYSFSRQNWQADDANLQRGRDWLAQIYQHNHAATQQRWVAHKDFDWISENITYGLYLSDHTILDDIETQLVVLTGIMMQNLSLETGWHLRGTRRVGVTSEDVEILQQCIEKVAAFCGLTLNRVPRVKDIEHEVKAPDATG